MAFIMEKRHLLVGSTISETSVKSPNIIVLCFYMIHFKWFPRLPGYLEVNGYPFQGKYCEITKLQSVD